MAIHWTPLLAIGVGPVDAQHRAIFELANRLLEAMKSGRSAREVSGLVHDLSDVAAAHFAFEEALMERAGYPRLDEHRAAHAALQCELAGLLGEHDGTGLTAGLAVQTKHFVCDWLLLHLPRDDQEFGRWLGRRRAPRIAAAG